MRQALSLAPHNKAVVAALASFQLSANVPALLKLVQKLATSGDAAAGDEALRLLRDPGTAPQTSAVVECIEILVLKSSEVPKPVAAQLVAELLRASRGAREQIATRLDTEGVEKIMVPFEKLGEEALDGLVVVNLDSVAWKSIDGQSRCLRELFKSFLAPPTNIRAVSRLLAAKADELHPYMNTAGFEAILRSLDINCPIELRSHATLAAGRFIETSGDISASMMGKFVVGQLAADGNDDLRQAYSAAAAVFPLVPTVAAQLFLTEGFVEGVVPSLSGRPVDVEQAALEMLSAACVEKTCRGTIKINCGEYLETLVKGTDGGLKSLAAVVLAKMKYGAAEPGKLGQGMEELAGVFRGMMLDEAARDSSIEGLAYASLKGSVKTSLVKDKTFVNQLLETLRSPPASTKPTTLFGALTILQNLTVYPPPLTEEQKKVAQLKNYADSKPNASIHPDPEDAEPAVTGRCKTLLDAGIIPVLITVSRRISANSIALVSNIMLSLSQHQKHRGLIAQQGGIKILLTFFATSLDSDNNTSRDIRLTSAHAVARILVSVDPSHVFSSSLPIATAVRPLSSLLESPPENNLLPVFEALLALTNLASVDEPIREIVLRMCWSKVEELLLSSNTLVSRAAVELVCNLQASPAGIAKFADGTKAAKNRMHILLALSDAEDLATRSAAGGALAMLTEWQEARRAVVERDNGIKRVLGICAEEDEGCRHRGMVVVRNLVCESPGFGEEVKQEGGVDVLRESLRGTRNPDVLAVGIEALKVLLGKT